MTRNENTGQRFPMDLRMLEELIRTQFTCIDGTPRGYMEIPHTISKDGRYHFECYRWVYEVVGVSIVGEREAAEPILTGWLWQKLEAHFPEELREDRAVMLVFRRRLALEGYIDRDGRVCHKLTMRLFIPAFELSAIFNDAVLTEGQPVKVL